MIEKIIIINFGSQYTHLIANKIRKLGVFSEIINPDVPLNFKRTWGLKGIILSGGPDHYTPFEKPPIEGFPMGKFLNKEGLKIFNLGVPILGICYGHELIVKLHGGKVQTLGGKMEYGKTRLKVIDKTSILNKLQCRETVWMNHIDTVTKLPEGFKILASTKNSPIAVIEHPLKKIFGVQFHPEVSHTYYGTRVFKNFLSFCEIKKDWIAPNLIDNTIQEIQRKAKNKKIYALISGGVDSTVNYVLLNKALGNQRVFGVHIETGFAQKKQTESIKKSFKKIGVENFQIIKASKYFRKALENIIDPEEKRNIIGNLFIEVWKKELAKYNLSPNKWALSQGTIYPDTVETGRTHFHLARRIKTHHAQIKTILESEELGDLLEPLGELYKDEVRKVGKELGLPEGILWRHPFPASGLAVRILCSGFSSEPEKSLNSKLGEPEAKIRKIAKKYCLKAKILPIRTVGTQADQRTYTNPLVLKGTIIPKREKEIQPLGHPNRKTQLNSKHLTGFTTGREAGCRILSWDNLEKISSKFTNTFKEINRVIYLIYPQDLPLEGLKLKKALLTKERIKLAREADEIARKNLEKAGLTKRVGKMPVVLIPISLTGYGESLVLRPILTEDGMTAEFAKLPQEVIQNIVEDIISFSKKQKKLPKIEAIFYDITNKPPATIEWE